MSNSSSEKVHPQSGSFAHNVPETPPPTDKTQQLQTSVHPVEPEDPKGAGTSDSQKAALDLNVGSHRDADHAGQPGHQAEEHPETSAGQHATGSFTDRKQSRKTA